MSKFWAAPLCNNAVSVHRCYAGAPVLPVFSSSSLSETQKKKVEYLNFAIYAGTTGGRTARAPMDDPIRNTGAPLQLAWQNGSRTFLTCVSASLTTFENLLMAWRGSGGWGSLSPCPAASKLSVAMFSAAR